MVQRRASQKPSWLPPRFPAGAGWCRDAHGVGARRATPSPKAPNHQQPPGAGSRLSTEHRAPGTGSCPVPRTWPPRSPDGSWHSGDRMEGEMCFFFFFHHFHPPPSHTHTHTSLKLMTKRPWGQRPPRGYGNGAAPAGRAGVTSKPATETQPPPAAVSADLTNFLRSGGQGRGGLHLAPGSSEGGPPGAAQQHRATGNGAKGGQDPWDAPGPEEAAVGQSPRRGCRISPKAPRSRAGGVHRPFPPPPKVIPSLTSS